MDSIVKVATYIIAGAVVVSLFQSKETGTVISSLSTGFANILGSMKGTSGPGTGSERLHG